MKTWLLLDCNYLCHRAYHSTPATIPCAESSRMIYGFFRDLTILQNRFQTANVAFCFDAGKPIRCELFPDYKAKRNGRERTDDEQQQHNYLISGMTALRDGLLDKIGFRNVFAAIGYEADDLIGELDKELWNGYEKTIIGSDKDLLQLIDEHTSAYNPQMKTLTDEKAFHKRFGIYPNQWADAKAIAGCSTDNVPGIKGVGEITACRFLADKLKLTSKAFKSITSSEGQAIWKRNLPLVSLPYPGTPAISLREDRVSATRWRTVIKELGLDRLQLKPPVFSYNKLS